MGQIKEVGDKIDSTTKKILGLLSGANQSSHAKPLVKKQEESVAPPLEEKKVDVSHTQAKSQNHITRFQLIINITCDFT